MQRKVLERTAIAEDHLPAELHPVLRRVFLNRGVSTPEQLELSLERLLPYHSLKGIEAAVALLVEALQAQKSILVVGDFDADGATSTALACAALKAMGAERVDYLVPDRFRFGYGLSPEIVTVALARRPDLLITVDNGISSLEGVAAAREAGVQVLITDHHLPGSQLPVADAIVNPNQPGCAFPSKAIAGVGVIFYVMAALRAKLRAQQKLPDPDWSIADLLDLVALGTVADVVPLDYNNRILVEQGLRRIRHKVCRPGIRALLQVAGRDAAGVRASDLGFAVGPRLNAAGRLQDMALGIECLVTTDPARASALASELDRMNQERRDIQAGMQAQALAIVHQQARDAEVLPAGLCVHDPAWHEGVVGLVASYLKEQHHRPCIAFAQAGEPGMLKGSARSIPGLHIRDALDRVATLHPGMIQKFGGHAMAAGLSLAEAQFAAFDTAFNQVLSEWLEPTALQPVIECDGRLTAEQLSLGTAEQLEQAGPWGQGFPEPVFHGDFEILDQRILKGRHLKLRVCAADEGAEVVDAIAFNAISDDTGEQYERLHLVYRIGVNDYRGRRSPQLVVDAIQPCT